MMFQATAQQPPPTPPRDIQDNCVNDALDFLDSSLKLAPSSACRPALRGSDADLNTPPPSSPLNKLSSRSRQIKRIRFVPEPLPKPDTGEIVQLRVLPPSREVKCKKSILKSYTPSPSCESPNPFSSPLAGQVSNTFPRMLDSIIQQLAGRDMISIYEAYQTLSSCLKTYAQTPDPGLLESKLPILEDFLRRDLVSKASDGRSPVHRLPLLALKTTHALLLCVSNARAFNQEFLAFLVDQATMALNATNVPKELVLNYMHVLTQQKVYVKAMTRNRSQKVLVSLATIHERITGNNVHRLRLMIYQRFIRFCAQSTIDNLHHWLPLVFHGMLADNVDIRARSIETALTAGCQLPETRLLSQAVGSVLNHVVGKEDNGEDRKYHAHFISRLGEFLTKPESREHTPQIWGAMMLLIQADGKRIENWLTNKQWLALLETCFNTSDASLNLHGWLAWNKTIFAARCLLGTSLPVMRRLRAPIMGHLQRRTNGKITEAAFSTYTGLLYYAFAPNMTPQQRDQSWKMLVQDVVSKIVQSNPGESSKLCTILSALFSRQNTSLWEVSRALRTSEEPFALHETPRLDAHWLRSNIDKIGEAVKVLLASSQPVDQCKLWSSLLSAVGDVNSKEIKASQEARKATAVLTSILCSLSKPKPGSRQTVKSITGLATALIEAVTPSQACDPFLLKSASGVFEIPSSPSRQNNKLAGHCVAPVVAMMQMFGSLDQSIEVDTPLRIAVQDLLRPCWQTRPSRKAKVQYLRMCSASLTAKDQAAKVRAQLWQSVVELASETLQLHSSDPGNAVNPIPGTEIRDLVTILIIGLEFGDTKSLRLGEELFFALRHFVKSLAGDAGVLMDLLTPLMDAINYESETCDRTAAVHYTGCIIGEEIVMPISERLAEQARRALWGPQATSGEALGPNWLAELYTLIDDALIASYACLDTMPGAVVQKFLQALNSYLDGPESSQRTSITGPELFLFHISGGVSAYLKDALSMLDKMTSRGTNIRPEVRKLWLASLGIAARLRIPDSKVLEIMEETLCAGFRSRSKTMVNLTIAAWNKTFGAQSTLAYPERLKAVLARLKNLAEIELPGFTVSEGELQDAEDDASMFLWLTSSRESQQVDDPPQSTFPASTAPSKSLHTSVLQRSARSTPTRKLGYVSKTTPSTPPARLRHDDSQVQFVAVNSSPIDSTSYDSQLLTERQREVRARQQADTAIFSDIRSSPITESTRSIARIEAPRAESKIDVQPVESNIVANAPDEMVVAEINAATLSLTVQAVGEDAMDIETNIVLAHDRAVQERSDMQIDAPVMPQAVREVVDIEIQSEVEVDNRATNIIEPLDKDETVQESLLVQTEVPATVSVAADQLAQPRAPIPPVVADVTAIEDTEIVQAVITEAMDIDEATHDEPKASETTKDLPIHHEQDQSELQADMTKEDSPMPDAAEDTTDLIEETQIEAAEREEEIVHPENEPILPAVTLTPHVVINDQRPITLVPRTTHKRLDTAEDDSDLIILKPKTSNSPFPLNLKKDAQASSFRNSPSTSFVSTSTPARAQRKRAASAVQDDEDLSPSSQRATKRRRSGRLSQNSPAQHTKDDEAMNQSTRSATKRRRSARLSQVEDVENDSQPPTPSQSQAAASAQSQSQSQSQSQASESFSQSSQRRSNRLSGDVSTLSNGMQTPRRKRRFQRLVQSTAAEVAPSRPAQEDEDEDELSQDVVPDTALPMATPTSQRRRARPALGRTPEPSSLASPANSVVRDANVDRKYNFSHGQSRLGSTSPMKLTLQSMTISAPSTPRTNQTAQPATSPPASLAKSIIGRLYGILADCKTLVLGPGDKQEREDLEDAAQDVSREITKAVRRGHV